MRVVRIYHAGRDAAHRARERALVAKGVELRLVVPSRWPGSDGGLADEGFDVVELEVDRPGDVNRHRYRDTDALREAVQGWRPDVVDLHEEPFSVVAGQVLNVIGDLPLVMYSAQNLDKRWPPPFSRILQRSYARVAAFYPCSRQAAAVLRGSGYRGQITPMPLGIDPDVHQPGAQDITQDLVLGLVGRLVPEKGLLDALAVVERLQRLRPTRLLVVGSGPDEARGREVAAHGGLDVQWHPWVSAGELAELYRQIHVVLVPSRATATWVEQFGRVITEGWANGAVPVGYVSGSIPEVIGGAGRVVPEGDVEALGLAVEDLVRDPQEWTRLRVVGQERAAEMSWPAVAASMVAVYTTATVSPKPPPPHQDRPSARREFGLPARTPVSDRPIALPVLRSWRSFHRLLDRRLS